MSLTLYFMETKPVEVHSQNITHNLGAMAEEAGLYYPLWRPEEIGITKASELIPYLESGIRAMEKDPEKFKIHNAKNGWGSYDRFLPWLKKLLTACYEHPDSSVEACR